MLSSHCRTNKPHLGLCPETNVPLQGRLGSWGCIPYSPGESGFLSSSNRYLLDSTAWPKGSQASYGVWRKDSGLLSRPCRKRRPSSRDGGESRGFSRAVAPGWGFPRGTMGSSGSLSCGAREVTSPMRVAKGSASLYSSHGRGIVPQDALKKDSPGLSRVAAGNPGFPRLVPVTSGSISGCL